MTDNMRVIARVFVLMAVIGAEGFDIKLSHMSTVYLPYEFVGTTPKYGFDKDAVETFALDPVKKIIYAVGEKNIHVIDASNASDLTYLDHVSKENIEFRDVTVCKDHVFVTFISGTSTQLGGVRVYRSYDKTAMRMEEISTFTDVGAEPKSIEATDDCTIVVAAEAGGEVINRLITDRPGMVTILRFTQGYDKAPQTNKLDFTAFDQNFDQQYGQSGVRWVYRGSNGNNPFSNDAEPESITFNDDFSKAFVTLQGNNAIAEVDLRNNRITKLHGLGFKQWGEFDASDKDDDTEVRSAASNESSGSTSLATSTVSPPQPNTSTAKPTTEPRVAKPVPQGSTPLVSAANPASSHEKTDSQHRPYREQQDVHVASHTHSKGSVTRGNHSHEGVHRDQQSRAHQGAPVPSGQRLEPVSRSYASAAATSTRVSDNNGGARNASSTVTGVSSASVRGINITSWPLYGMYQPDYLQYVAWKGAGYIITANEGDSKDYDNLFNEEARAADVKDGDIAATVSSSVKTAMQDDRKLGRLLISTIDGKDADGKFEKFYTYGARSFSIWKTSTMARVYDSGSELEQKTSELRPDLFNGDTNADDTVADGFDKRSDDKGPEAESLAVAKFGDYLVIFVGCERPGSIFVYSVKDNMEDAKFELLYTDGIPKEGSRTYGDMYDARDLFAVDPEYLSFVPAKTLADHPVLLVSGAQSGTITALKVEVTGATTSGVDGVRAFASKYQQVLSFKAGRSLFWVFD
ncbi:hypothetical protein BaRGS_00002978 [Batillaria attramentaria]|uniref:Choice-of-anchor I domain-containing protein n=1 Tax=Batillaria attramentaria TaxID=370345 RepID=A0ABD0M3E8_9CAEN